MALKAGARLGPYEILDAIGAGGMGEVYRARDARLGRDVAIKVLPPAFSTDTDRLSRFEQEARAAAALNHPNILAVYDIGTHPSTGSGQASPYIVSELLEGQTLREAATAAHAGLPVRKATEYAIQIARGLAAAHEKGIVHRDLKPENVFITLDGRVKILDLGLAKLTQSDPLGTATNVPTTPRFETQPGMLLGTMGYMAPEQVRGLPADHRADIFAFGVILYEMLSGLRAFQGATSADTITAILKEDPPDLPLAERHIPPALERIVDRCLEKSPAARFQTATDLAFALESLSSHSDRTDIAVEMGFLRPRRSRERIAWGVAALLGLALIGTGGVAVRHLREAPPPAEPVQFHIPAAENTVLVTSPQPAISPDGRQIAFIASRGVNMVWVRPLAALDAQPLAGTEGAAFPFWSPDSRVIGFFADGKLKKIQVSGGPSIVLCDAESARGGTWNSDNTIVFAPAANGALQKVSSAGGTPAPASILDKTETAHRFPWFLPDGRHFVFLAVTGSAVSAGLRVGSLESSETTSLGPASSNAAYGSGHLLFVRGGNLMALPFDAERRQPRGEALPIVERLGPFLTTLHAPFSVSATGVLGYGRGYVPLSQLTWFDRTGKPLGKVGDFGYYFNLSLSPDQRRLAVSIGTGAPMNIDIWLIDLARDATRSRLTFDPAYEFDPVWSPDGSWVAFTSNRTGITGLYRRASSGGGQDEAQMESSRGATAPDWSPDGRSLVYSTGDVMVLPLPAREPVPFLQTAFNESDPTLSPDGRWIAYASNESGQAQIYVQSFPKSGGKYLVSREGGSEPRWRGDGEELFFLAPDGAMMAARIDAAKDFQATVPIQLFQTGLAFFTSNHPYVVTRDGKRFLIPVVERAMPAPLMVRLNWPASVQK